MRKCSKCFYFDLCSVKKVSKCDCYTPTDDDVTDGEVRKMVEGGQEDYYKAYLGYLDAFYND